jgi:hypothetical protein
MRVAKLLFGCEFLLVSLAGQTAGCMRPGVDLYTASALALDPDTAIESPKSLPS